MKILTVLTVLASFAITLILMFGRPVPCYSGTQTESGKSPWFGSCTACGDDEFSIGGNAVCLKCPIGTLKSNKLDADGIPCFPCEEGMYFKMIGGECGKCPSKQQVKRGGDSGVALSCELCPIGTYNPTPGSEKCTSCPDGKTTYKTGSQTETECI
jgi:signal peptide, CUB and EGF-like domain-containing protein 1/3